MKAKTGSSLNPDGKSAGREAAEKIKKELTKASVVFAYVSSDYYNDLPGVIEGIAEVFPGTPIIGGTSWHGVVLPEGLVTGKYFVGLMALDDDDLVVGIGGANNYGDAAGARKGGRLAALAAMKKAGRDKPPNYYFMSAMPGFEEYYIKGIGEAVGRLPMFGNGVSDNLINGDWDIFTDEGVVGYGLAAAFFYTDKGMVNHYTSAPYYELEEKCIITKMHTPRRLGAIEGDCLLDRILERTSFDRDLLTAGDLQMACILDPLGVKDRLGDLTALRLPMNLRPDGSMDIAANLAEGTMFIHMQTTVDELVAASGRELKALASKMKGRAAAYHLSMSYGRAMVMRDDGKLDKAVRLIQKAAGDVPFIMPFTLSESGFVDDGANTSGNLMLSYTGFFA